MKDILEIARVNFLSIMQRQNTQWSLIDAGLVEEETDAKPIKAKREKKKKPKKDTLYHVFNEKEVFEYFKQIGLE